MCSERQNNNYKIGYLRKWIQTYNSPRVNKYYYSEKNKYIYIIVFYLK